MRITHARKKQMARRMMTRTELVYRTPVFQSAAWEKRAIGKRLKQNRYV